MENIKRGTFVIEYVGEIITSEEAERRGQVSREKRLRPVANVIKRFTDVIFAIGWLSLASFSGRF